MKNFLRLLFLLPAIVLAAGSTANLSWTLPVTYTDNSPLPATDIAFVTVQWTLGGVAQTQKVTTAPMTSTVVNVPCGSTAFTVLVTTTATAKYPNETSGPTNPLPYATGIQCVPNPVTGVTVN